MLYIKDKENCTGCSSCMNVCPKQCIEMKEDEFGFKYPYVNKDICIDCHLCKKVCPLQNEMATLFQPKIYAVQSNNEEMRKNSSSGGVFSILANNVLDNGGVVYGAYFNDDLEVEHIKITSKNDLYKIRGSKYLQSNIKYSFKEIKEYLINGTHVLFSGTGCQIAGLKSYLHEDYHHLLTVEVVCHGVPSQMVFRKYKDIIEKENKSQLKTVNFRDKKDGWNNYSLTFSFENGNVLSEKFNENDFMRGYIHNLYLRPSCKVCKFKKMTSGSDFLLGDFWGVDELGKPWNDNKGTSVVFINTNNGMKLFNNIKKDIFYKEVDYEYAVRFNPCIIKPVETSKDIYNQFDKMLFHDIIESNIPKIKKQSMFSKIKGKLYQLRKR